LKNEVESEEMISLAQNQFHMQAHLHVKPTTKHLIEINVLTAK
jgi:hypothetical protein